MSRSRTNRVTILRDPGVPRDRYCWTLLLLLRTCIEVTFNSTVLVLGPRSLAHDFVLMSAADAFISSVSSLGMFAGIAGYGTAHFPVNHQAAGSTSPCFPGSNVRWYKVRVTKGESIAVSDPELRADKALSGIPKDFVGQPNLLRKMADSLERNPGPWTKLEPGIDVRAALRNLFRSRGYRHNF